MTRCRHCCPDWDFLLIDEHDPEFEACLCFKALCCASCGSVGHYSRREIDAATAVCWVCKRPHFPRIVAAARAVWRAIRARIRGRPMS
jgi:hypothetical protein